MEDGRKERWGGMKLRKRVEQHFLELARDFLSQASAGRGYTFAAYAGWENHDRCTPD